MNLSVRNASVGFPPARFTAKLGNEYVGRYTYSMYWRSWDLVIDTTHFEWVVQAVDLEGRPIGKIRRHCTPIDVRSFSDRPYDPWAR